MRQAIAAGKHVYCEKPSASSLADALDLAARARGAGVKHGVVQDKLWLPGIARLRELRDAGFFGRILSIRGEFGYWVFEGDSHAGAASLVELPPRRGRRHRPRHVRALALHPRRPGGRRASIACLAATHIPRRWDEAGQPYAATADDAAYAIFELEGGAIAQFNSSWCVRVRRDDLLTIQVDGTAGSAVAGLRRCWMQPAAATPRPVWNPDDRRPPRLSCRLAAGRGAATTGNAFRVQWERFLRHVADDGPFPWDLMAGARGVQLAEIGLEAWRDRRWLDVPPLGAGGAA